MNEFILLLDKYHNEHPQQRSGQAMMNCLQKYRPDLYQLVYEQMDCFERDDNLYDVWVFLIENW